MSKGKVHYAWLVAVGCAFISLIGVGLFQNCPGIFFKPVADDFGIGRGQVATYITIQGYVMLVGFLIVGRILTKVNIRILLTAAAGLLCLTFMAMSQITSFYQFYIAGAVCGLCLSVCGSLVIPVLINNWFKEKAGTVIGLVMACSSIGGAAFLTIGSIIIQDYDWRTGYFVFGLIGLVLLPFTIFVIRFKPSDMGMKPFGDKETEAVTAAAAPTGSTAPAVLPGVSAKRALSSTSFYLLIIFVAAIMSIAAFNSAMPGYASSLGMSPTLGGLSASFVLIGAIFGKLMLGYLNDNFGIIKATAVMLVLGLIGIVLLLLKISVPVFLAGAVCFGFAFALGTVEPPIALKDIFGMKDYSVLYSYVSVAMSLFFSSFVPVFSLFYDYTQSYVPSLIFVFVFFIAGFISLLIAKKTGKRLADQETKERGVYAGF